MKGVGPVLLKVAPELLEELPPRLGPEPPDAPLLPVVPAAEPGADRFGAPGTVVAAEPGRVVAVEPGSPGIVP